MDYAPYPHSDNYFLLLWRYLLFTGGVSSHSHHHSPKQKKALQLRIRKMAGQLTAIERMVETDVDCPDVLTQIVSVRKALKSLAELIIHDHLHECIGGAHDAKEGQRKLRELLTVLERFVE